MHRECVIIIRIITSVCQRNTLQDHLHTRDAHHQLLNTNSEQRKTLFKIELSSLEYTICCAVRCWSPCEFMHSSDDCATEHAGELNKNWNKRNVEQHTTNVNIQMMIVDQHGHSRCAIKMRSSSKKKMPALAAASAWWLFDMGWLWHRCIGTKAHANCLGNTPQTMNRNTQKTNLLQFILILCRIKFNCIHP